MTRANNDSKSRTPKVQRKYLPKDVLKVMRALPRDPILDLMKKSKDRDGNLLHRSRSFVLTI